MEIGQALNYHPDKLPNDWAPPRAEVTPGAARLMITEDAGISGPRDLVTQTMAQFDVPPDYVYKGVDVGGHEFHKMPNGRYRVTMPEIGSYFDYDSFGEARRAANSWGKDFDRVRWAGYRKGLDVFYDGHVYMVSDGTRMWTAKNIDELNRIYRRFPDVEYSAQEVFEEMSEEVESVMPEVKTRLKEELGWSEEQVERFLNMDEIPRPATAGEMSDLYEGVRPISAKSILSMNWKNMDDVMETISRQMNDPEILKLYEDLENGRRLAVAEENNLIPIVNQIFSKGEVGKKLKRLDDEHMRRIYYWMGGQEAEMPAIWEKFGRPGPEDELRITQIRKIYDHLAVRIGIDPKKFVDNYMPRIRKAFGANQAKLNEMIMAEDLLNHAFPEGPPSELKIMFDQDRLNVLLQIVVDENAYRVTLKYIGQGLKKAHMNEAWKKMYKHIQGLQIRGISMKNGALVGKLNDYREQVMGYWHPDGFKNLMQVGSKTNEWLWDHIPAVRRPGRLKDEFMKSGQLLYQKMFALNYLTNMAFRPYFAFRNAHQVWTTLDPIFGNVSEAIQYVLKHEDEVYAYLRRTGVITNAMPLANRIDDATSMMNKMLESGLSWFKNSDEFTRAIAYTAARMRYEEAVEAMRAGVIKTKAQFIDVARLDYFNEATREKVWQFAWRGTMEGKPDVVTAGRDFMGWRASENSMFGYRASATPDMHKKSVIGKMFGQYGTYSAGYRHQVLGTLRNLKGNRAKQIAYITKFLINHGILWGYTTALGMKATNYIPMMPGIFTGGPMWDVAYLVSQSLDLGTQDGKLSRQELARSMVNLAPGVLQVKYLKKAIEYADGGDPWRAFLAITTAPVNPNAPFEAF